MMNGWIDGQKDLYYTALANTIQIPTYNLKESKFFNPTKTFAHLITEDQFK